MKKRNELKIVFTAFLFLQIFLLDVLFAHDEFDGLVNTVSAYLPKLEAMNVTGDKKVKIDALISGARAFTNTVPSSKPSSVVQLQQVVTKKEEVDHDEDETIKDSDTLVVQDVHDETQINDQDDADEPILEKPSAKQTTTPVTTPVTTSVTTPIKLAPIKPISVNPVVSQQDHGGFEIVRTYLKAKDAFALADKKNPLVISPFAGDADKAARKAYTEAKAALVAPEKAYKAWLEKAQVTDTDFIKVKTQISASLQTFAQKIAEAKKDNPTLAITAKQKANRAIYDEATMRSDIRKALVKELEKKK